MNADFRVPALLSKKLTETAWIFYPQPPQIPKLATLQNNC